MTTRKSAKTTTRQTAAATTRGSAKRVSKKSTAQSAPAKPAPKPAKSAATKRPVAKPAEPSVAETLIERSRIAAQEAIERSEASNRKYAELASATVTTVNAETEAFAEALVEPVQALNALTIENAGKVVDLQMVAFRRYSELVFGGARELTSLDDPEAVQAFVVRQGEAVRSLTSAAAEDFQSMTRIGLDYFQAASAILNRSITRSV